MADGDLKQAWVIPLLLDACQGANYYLCRLHWKSFALISTVYGLLEYDLAFDVTSVCSR